MKNKTTQYFFLGLMIAFIISVLSLSIIMTIISDVAVLPISLIWQVLVLSILCSLINLVYQSEKLKFIWQSIIGYILTTTTIISCVIVFDWYSFGGNEFDKAIFILVMLLISCC